MSGAGKLNEPERDEVLIDLIVQCRIVMRRAARVVVGHLASESEKQDAARGLYGMLEKTNYLDTRWPR